MLKGNQRIFYNLKSYDELKNLWKIIINLHRTKSSENKSKKRCKLC